MSVLKAIILSSILLLPSKLMAAETEIGVLMGGQHLIQSMIVCPQDKSISFTWEVGYNRYVFATIPVGKIQLEFNNNMLAPALRFRWTMGPIDGRDMQHLIDEKVQYALLVCSKEYWNKIINCNSKTVFMFGTEKTPPILEKLDAR